MNAGIPPASAESQPRINTRNIQKQRVEAMLDNRLRKEVISPPPAQQTQSVSVIPEVAYYTAPASDFNDEQKATATGTRLHNETQKQQMNRYANYFEQFVKPQNKASKEPQHVELVVSLPLDEVVSPSESIGKERDFSTDFLSTVMRAAIEDTDDDLDGSTVTYNPISDTTKYYTPAEAYVGHQWGVATHGWGERTSKPTLDNLFAADLVRGRKTGDSVSNESNSPASGRKKKKRSRPRRKEKGVNESTHHSLHKNTAKSPYNAGSALQFPPAEKKVPVISDEKRRLQSITDKLRHAELKRVEAETALAKLTSEVSSSVKNPQKIDMRIPLRNHYPPKPTGF